MVPKPPKAPPPTDHVTSSKHTFVQTVWSTPDRLCVSDMTIEQLLVSIDTLDLAIRWSSAHPTIAAHTIRSQFGHTIADLQGELAKRDPLDVLAARLALEKA